MFIYLFYDARSLCLGIFQFFLSISGKDMIWGGLVLVFMIGTSVEIHAEKLYKIIDEKGKVSFSQFPPKENNENVESFYINTFKNELQVKKIGNKEYCGSIYLPPYTSHRAKKDNYYLENLTRSLTTWKDRLESTKQSIEMDSQDQFRRSNSRYGKYENSAQKSRRFTQWEKRNKKNVEKVKELSCAISWAEGQKNIQMKSDLPRQNTKEVERLNALLVKHKKKMYEICGSEPIFDPTSSHKKLKSKSWEECSRPYKKDLNRISERIGYILRN